MVGSINQHDEAVGLLRRATIIKCFPNNGVMKVRLANKQSLQGQSATSDIEIPLPHSMFYNNGMYIGSYPAEGTPIIVGQGSGNQYYFVSFFADVNYKNVPNLKLGELLLQSNQDTKITLGQGSADKDDNFNINIGSDINKIHINTRSSLITTTFNNQNHFTHASRKVEGVVKRDLIRNTKITQDNKLESDDYDSKFKVVGMDPSSTANSFITGSNKNPPFVESREIVYEFQYASDVDNDPKEATRYGTEKPTPLDLSFPNRRKSRADTLSLSLVAPNFLIETIKGTVVDIFGNILDINRFPLPIGKTHGQNTINKDQSTDKVASFLTIKEIERKSLAYHFEINARKNLISPAGLSLPDIKSNADWARNRSRFFVDIDKEGQFKLNVPASSEVGNIPLLTRYENYSTFGDDNNNPNKLVYRSDNIDIYQDSFASTSYTSTTAGFIPATDGSKGSIELKTGGGASPAPQDRITGQVIKHGTAYHDILQTCFIHQNNDFLNYQAGEVDPLTVNLSTIPALKNIVSKTIIVSGDNANAGGRSGSLNFDGSLEMNIGANTVDRQSLWLDTAGGLVANIGRDINGRSIMMATGGDFYLQVGGFGVTGDSRFITQNNGIKAGVLDLRIVGAGGYCHMIRCDDFGITIMTPGSFKAHSKGEMILTSDTSIKIESPQLVIQERPVLRGLPSI